MKRSGFKQKTIEEVRATQAAKRLKLPQDKRNALKRKQTKATVKRRKKGQWSTPHADNMFSRWIRERDRTCRRCGRTDQLTCSHYHKRAISITRFCPINCITLCGECHALWEGPKKEYTEYMVTTLGETGFIELQKKAGTFMKRSDAVAECKKLIRPVDNSPLQANP